MHVSVSVVHSAYYTSRAGREKSKKWYIVLMEITVSKAYTFLIAAYHANVLSSFIFKVLFLIFVVKIISPKSPKRNAFLTS